MGFSHLFIFQLRPWALRIGAYYSAHDYDLLFPSLVPNSWLLTLLFPRETDFVILRETDVVSAVAFLLLARRLELTPLVVWAFFWRPVMQPSPCPQTNFLLGRSKTQLPAAVRHPKPAPLLVSEAGYWNPRVRPLLCPASLFPHHVMVAPLAGLRSAGLPLTTLPPPAPGFH